MITGRLVLAVALLAFAGLVVALNWGCTVSNMLKKNSAKRPRSTIPLASVILTTLAYHTHPGRGWIWMVSIPVFDIGNWWLLALPITMIRARGDQKVPRETKT